MKLTGLPLLVILLCYSLSVDPAVPSEIGFSIGTSYRSSDIVEPINLLRMESIVENEGEMFIITTGDELDAIPFGHRVGATYLDFIYVNTLPFDGFELEHNAFATFGAQESVRKHGIGYSANLNYVTPWYPEIMLWRMKPFIGAGAGYAYIFGRNNAFAPGDYLGSGGEFHFNIGGGVKIHVHKQWWMRLTVRDAIAPSAKKLEYYERMVPDNPENPNGMYSGVPAFNRVRKTSHHILVFFSLVRSSQSSEDFEY